MATMGNDIRTGRAAAAFVHEQLQLTKVGTVDIGDAHIAGLVNAFSAARRGISRSTGEAPALGRSS